MKLLFFKTLGLLLVLYVLICILLYFLQERIIFFPYKLNKNFNFSFSQPFDELYIKTKDGQLLNGLLFTAPNPKGMVFYLHGNAGALNTWGEVAKRYTDLHYDVFIIDYRGYGKSEGAIENSAQLLEDVQAVYSKVKRKYKEEDIVIIGYSLGSGPAAWLTSVNHPRMLILQAPYYSMTDMMKHYYPVIPTFLLKYKFDTNEYLKGCPTPIVIFHGDKDEVIYYHSSTKLKAVLKSTDTLITLSGQGHNGITDNPQYLQAINTILK